MPTSGGIRFVWRRREAKTPLGTARERERERERGAGDGE